MRRPVILLILIAAGGALFSAVSFVARHYRIVELNPGELAAKQPKPPELPLDCGEIRRAVKLSAESVAARHEKAIEITASLDADETAIYRAVVEQWNAEHRTVLNVSIRTFAIDIGFPSEQRECGCWAGLSADSLLKASHSFHVLNQIDLPEKNLRLVDPEQQTIVVARNDPDNTMRKGASVDAAVAGALQVDYFHYQELRLTKSIAARS